MGKGSMVEVHLGGWCMKLSSGGRGCIWQFKRPCCLPEEAGQGTAGDHYSTLPTLPRHS